MKKLLMLILLLVIAMSVKSENPRVIKSDFKKLEISVSSRVCIYLGDEISVRLSTDSITKKYINYIVSNGKLIIKPIPGYEDYLRGRRVNIYIVSPKDSISINAGRYYSIQKNKNGNHVKK